MRVRGAIVVICCSKATSSNSDAERRDTEEWNACEHIRRRYQIANDGDNKYLSTKLEPTTPAIYDFPNM